jgi:ketosteroid isomerase-like protein
MIRKTMASILLMFSMVLPVIAGPLDDAKARAHLDAVASGDIEALMRDYAPDAYMDWVGGPLEGRYQGEAAIRQVWVKFIAANDGKPRAAKFSKLESYANPKGASIEIKANYGGKTPLQVWHVLTYRDGVLCTEIWQISPKLEITP